MGPVDPKFIFYKLLDTFKKSRHILQCHQNTAVYSVNNCQEIEKWFNWPHSSLMLQFIWAMNCKQWCLDTSSMLGSMKTGRAVTIFHFWYEKMIFSFSFSYGSCFRPRSRTKRSAKTHTKIVCCFWLLQTTYMEEMKAGSTGPPVQVTPLSPML